MKFFDATVEVERRLYLHHLRPPPSDSVLLSRLKTRSSTSDDLCSCHQTVYTVGRRAFSVAGARVWNGLPADVTSASYLFTFRKRLKLHLFSLFYPVSFHSSILALSTKLTFSPCVVLVVVFCYLDGRPP